MMANFKRKGPRTMRNRCMCKYWKHVQYKGSTAAKTVQERRAAQPFEGY